MRGNRLWFQASLVAVLGVAVLGSTLVISRQDYRFFDPLVEAHGIITQAYVDEPDESEMQRESIRAMVDSLGDPFTVFVAPSERREFDKDLTGQYVGIGALVQGSADGWLQVVTPLEDSPAAEAGLMAEDKIVEIEGESTFGKSADECVDLLAGNPGSTVSIVIERDGERQTVEVGRRRIVTKTVRGYHRLSDDQSQWRYMIDTGRRIGYVRLSQFNATTYDELRDALKSMGAMDGTLRGLILDLRGDPGGLLTAATDIADLFIKDGTIVSTKGRSHPEEVTTAQEAGTLPPLALVVLLNGQSASASEILAGALSERAGAIVVGTRSFGKGSVQSVRPIPSMPGGQIKVTEQRYYLPSGRCIHREEGATEWGVDPTDGFFVPLTREESIAMFRARQNEEIIGGSEDEGDWSSAEAVVERLKDPQLGAAVKAVQIRLDEGEWRPTGEARPSGNELLADSLEDARQTQRRLVRELARVDRYIEESLSGVDGNKVRSEEDFWPDETDLVGGSVTVRDAAGNAVAELEITGPNLERWLIDADVKAAKDGD